MSETILVIAPHPDDESIGCGGAIALHRRHGDQVLTLFLTSGEGSMKNMPAEEIWQIREAESRAALSVLSSELLGFLRLPDGRLDKQISQGGQAMAEAMEKAMGSIHPDRIYLPHGNEDHPDHQAVLPMLAAAYRQLGRAEPWLLGYEVWTPLDRYDLVEDISEVFSLKQAAVNCYQSQLEQFRYDRAMAGLNMYRGAMAGHCEYAEVFASLTFPV